MLAYNSDVTMLYTCTATAKRNNPCRGCFKIMNGFKKMTKFCTLCTISCTIFTFQLNPALNVKRKFKIALILDTQ